MECTHFKKSNLLKRLIGIKGYCTFHKTTIKQYKKVNYHPYVCCRGTNGVEFENCAVQLRLTDDT